MTISPEVFERYAAMRVPRYTSYPTAPNFSPAIDGTEYRRWLSAVAAGSKLSLYLHIPFCRQMCWYCGCHTSVTRRRSPISRYIDALVREIATVANELPPRMAVGHVHWGGGSPTLLAPADVARVNRAIREHFDLGDVSEIAVEIDPRTLTGESAKAFAHAGVNRASVGVQSFDPVVQLAINRVQSVETTALAVAMLRREGVRSINFDLIYGLPFQSVRSCQDTVAQALNLRPDRLAVFGYAHVPSFKPHQRRIDERQLPGPLQRWQQEQAIAEALIASGYVRVGLDHFALPNDSLAAAAAAGALHRNFQGYTVDSCDALIGFGASAIGRLPQGYVQNATRIPDYERLAGDGRVAVARGCPIGAEDRRRAAIIERLMCGYRADIQSVDVSLDQIETDGLIRRYGNHVEVIEEARPLVRAVAAAFDAYLPAAATRHVTAV